MIDKSRLQTIVIDTLKALDLYSDNAVKLLMGTAATESGFEHVVQLEDGPARGYFQMEPTTARDIYDNWLIYRLEILEKVNEISGTHGWEEKLETELQTNIPLMVALARLHYYRSPGALPDNLEDRAHYWKDNYNTELGKGRVVDFVVKSTSYGLA